MLVEKKEKIIEVTYLSLSFVRNKYHKTENTRPYKPRSNTSIRPLYIEEIIDKYAATKCEILHCYTCPYVSMQ